MSSDAIRSRKHDHINICLSKQVEYNKQAGFCDISFVHNSLPELDFGSIDTSTKFLSKKLGSPIIIEPITGGSDKAEQINRILAFVILKAMSY